ncbi:MAG: division/cell wall cluster transcriptional repressor MraZ [Candidatus Methylacidiphilales bacterium]
MEPITHLPTPLGDVYADSFPHAFDEKGRLTVPAEWRSERHDRRLLVMPSAEPCLKVFPASWLARQMEKLKDAPMGDPRRKRLQDLASASQTVEFDQQGRILIKERLRQRAGLTRKAMLVGRLDHFQIWDAAVWEAQAAADVSVEQVFAEVGL